MNTLELTKKLITIPSYLGSDCNEKKIADFLYQYLQQFSWLKVIKQKVVDNRYNIIAKDSYPTKVLICGHIDTVQPKQGWITNPFKPEIKQEKLYGLGATDMKGSIAALLSSLVQFKQTKGVMILLYVDEEYDFLGMKKFIQDYKNKIKPEVIISADGKNLMMGRGCRGLIEVNFKIKGLSGHAGKPKLGKNAITGTTNIVNQLAEQLEKNYSDPVLGKTSCNLAFIQGGLDLGKNNIGEQIFGKEGNNIADLAELVLDIRPANLKLNAKKIQQLLESLIQKEGLTLLDFKIRHNFGSWLTKEKELKKVEKVIAKILQPKYLKIDSYGYIDIQMLWQVFGKVPSFTFGPGEPTVAHKVNEYIEIEKLNQAKEVFEILLQDLGGGENRHVRI